MRGPPPLPALGPLVAAARTVALDHPDRVLAFVAGVLAAGIESPLVLERCLVSAGIGETRWREAAAAISLHGVEKTPRSRHDRPTGNARALEPNA